MRSIRYGNGSYRAESIVALSREEYIAKNKDKAFKGMPEANVIAKLGELWDMARAAVPVEVEAAPATVVEPETPNSKSGKGKGKPADPIPPTE